MSSFPPCFSHRRASGVAALLLAATLLLSTAHAVDGDVRMLRTNVAAVYTVWDADDVCGQPLQLNNCSMDVTCSACLTRPGCAVESTTGKCVSATRINATAVASSNNAVEYFLAGRSEYCDASDAACTTCGSDNATSNAVCRGAGGCVCVHQCEVAEAAAPGCGGVSAATGSFRWFFVVIAVGVALTGAIMARMFRMLTTELSASVVRREQRRAAHAEKPLTMKLDGWRGFIAKESTKDQTTDIKLCPTRPSELDDDNALSGIRVDSAALTEEDGSDYAAVSTPRSSESVQGHAV